MYHYYQCCLPGDRYHDYISIKKINMNVFIVIRFLLFHTYSITILFLHLVPILYIGELIVKINIIP